MHLLCLRVLVRLEMQTSSKSLGLPYGGDSRELNLLSSCNWLGGHASVLAMDWYGNETLHNTPFTNMTIGGKPVAAIQNVDNFSFAYVL